MPVNRKPTQYAIANSIAVITLDAPPVNSLGQAMRARLLADLRRAREDAAVKAVAIIGAGHLFCAGADIREFATGEIAAPDLTDGCVTASLPGMAAPWVADWS